MHIRQFMKPLLWLASGFIFSAVIFSASSCKKETDCKARIKCVDSLSAPVAGANVLLYAVVKSPDGKTSYTADLKANGTTGNEGQVEFVFELPAIYDIKA